MVTGKFILRYRWSVLLFIFAFLFATGAGTTKLEMETDGRVFFGENNPQLKAFEAFEDTYNKNQNILFVIEAKNGTVFTPATLAAVKKLTDDSWLIPYSSRVDSITNYQHTMADGDDLIVEDLVKNPEEITDKEMAHIRAIAISEPQLAKRAVSPSGHVTAVNVLTLMPGKSPNEITEIASYISKMADDFRSSYPELNLYISGGVPFDSAFGEVSQNDAVTLIPIMLFVMLFVIAMALRSIGGMFATVLVIVASAVTALGITGWLGIIMTPASATAPTIILTLAVADSIHILTTMFHEMQNGKSKYEAIIESLRINMQPVFITSVTTAIGFLSMNFSDAPPFHDLGNIVAMGVMAAFVYSVTLLPALMMILPVRPRRNDKGRTHFMERFGDFVVNRKKPLFYGMTAIMIFLAMGLPRIELDDVFSKYFDERYQIRIDSDFVEENLSGWNILEYSVGSGEENGIVKPEYLKNLEKLETWLKSQPEVWQVNSLVPVMKRLNRSMHGDDTAYYKIPHDRRLAAQYLLLYEMSLPFGLDLNSQINLDKSASRLTVNLGSLSSAQVREMAVRTDNWIEENLPPNMHAKATGESIMWAHISQRNIESMLGGISLALVLISGILVFALRSFKIGIISLIPNLAPAIMAFGLWGFVVGEVGLAVSVVAAMSLGIVVDDTVHFLSKYLRARREMSLSPGDAVRYSFRTVGVALLVTSATLAAGFMVLAVSGFKINSSMGILTAIAIVFALMADFLFLPPLLMKLDGDKGEAAGAGQPSRNLRLTKEIR